MSSTETKASSAPEFMSTRQFAKVSGRQHGNIVSMIRTMIKKRKLRLKESFYRNTEHGQTFVEFQLRQKDFEKLAHRLTDDEMRSVRNYFKPTAYSVEKVVTGGKEIVVTVPAFSFRSGSDVVTMSSLEIAELTDKEHKHVLRDIRNMLGKLEKAEAQIWSTAFLPGPNNSSREVEIANLSRDLTETLITGYSIPLRHAVVVRLRELEAQVAKPVVPALPDFSNPAEAARAWASEFDKA